MPVYENEVMSQSRPQSARRWTKQTFRYGRGKSVLGDLAEDALPFAAVELPANL